MDNNVVKVAIDAIRGKMHGEFSTNETSEKLRNAFIEMNGGSTKIDAKHFYRGNDLFELVQEIIPVIVDEGLRDDDELMKLVEYRNIKDGDEAEFVARKGGNLLVHTVASGIGGVRRQRLGDGDVVTIKTNAKAIRVYECLGRLLAGRVDFNEFVDEIAAAFKKQIMLDAYDCLYRVSNLTPGLNSTYVVSGSYSEASLLELVAHVEAATGMPARIIGTKAALRKVTTASVAEDAKSDMYHFGFYGWFNGTPMFAIRQAHQPGTDTFAFSDSVLYVVASEEKPIKLVNEGDGILFGKDATENADLTQEYTEIMQWGVGAIFAEKMGVYTISA